jgi:uncharacterized protein YjbI with pentapeptide repeats
MSDNTRNSLSHEEIGLLRPRADLNGRSFRKKTLPRDVDLTGAYLVGTDLRETTWPGIAVLQGASLNNAKLQSATLIGAKLRGARLHGASLRRAWLHGTDFFDANLSKADLTKAKLKGSDLRMADLRGAILVGADLTGADLTGTKVSRDELQRAIGFETLRGKEAIRWESIEFVVDFHCHACTKTIWVLERHSDSLFRNIDGVPLCRQCRTHETDSEARRANGTNSPVGDTNTNVKKSMQAISRRFRRS